MIAQMITIHALLRVSNNALPTTRTATAVLLSLLLAVLTGCTNSKLIIGPLYNRLDDQMRSEFHKLGSFNEQQIASFEQLVGTFHVWHRQSELPQYAQLLRTVESSIAESGKTDPDEIRRWIATAESFSRSIRECHPVNFSFNLMNSLTDDQVDYIERRFTSERRKNSTKHFKRTPEERVTRRVSKIVKWARRLGLEFTSKQKALLKKTFTEQISMRRQYYRLALQWNLQLFRLAREQEAPDYNDKMTSHFAALWTLLEKAHPDQWQANRELWRKFGYEFVASLTPDQRLKTSVWMRKMARTLEDISTDKPSFKRANNPRSGCTANQTTTG